MIIGIGTDMVDIHRIDALLTRFDTKARARLFTQTEQTYAESKSDANTRTSSYAKRFAAKEACAKALGTGFGSIAWTDVEVINNAQGAPHITLHGNAFAYAESLCPSGYTLVIHLSLADEFPYALAYVIIEAISL